MRMVVFLQDCKWNCKGCHNPHLFPLDEGIEIDEIQLAKVILKKLIQYILELHLVEETQFYKMNHC